MSKAKDGCQASKGHRFRQKLLLGNRGSAGGWATALILGQRRRRWPSPQGLGSDGQFPDCSPWLLHIYIILLIQRNVWVLLTSFTPYLPGFCKSSPVLFLLLRAIFQFVSIKKKIPDLPSEHLLPPSLWLVQLFLEIPNNYTAQSYLTLPSQAHSARPRKLPLAPRKPIPHTRLHPLSPHPKGPRVCTQKWIWQILLS